MIDDLEDRKESHQECVQDTRNLENENEVESHLEPKLNVPQASGRSLRTVVVFSSAKKAPRWIERKWLMYRSQLSFSATMVKPDACWRSRPVGDVKFPVARKLAIFEPMS